MKAKVAHPDCSIFTPHGESEPFEDSNHLGRRIAASVQNHEHRSGYERFVRSQCTIDIEVRACLFQGARSDSICCRTAFTRTGLSQRILSRRLFAPQHRIDTRRADACCNCLRSEMTPSAEAARTIATLRSTARDFLEFRIKVVPRACRPYQRQESLWAFNTASAWASNTIVQERRQWYFVPSAMPL